YQLGYNSRGKYIGQSFDSAENDLSNEWNSVRGTSRLSWNEAKSATRAAWDKVERAIPGDSDHDGK
ncbi:MAG TPA: hypothetical protein VFS02_19280, partial [Telluria sp.]|nr:hypothetical protein [Telluria sp.]